MQWLRETAVSLQIAISVTQPASEEDQNEDGTTQGLSGVLKILHYKSYLTGFKTGNSFMW